MSNDPAVRALMPHLCRAWHGEFKEQVARSIVAANRAYAANPGLALDAQPGSLDQQVHAFFHPKGSDQIMMTTTPTSGPPAGSTDYTGTSGAHRQLGGMQFHRRNGNTADQPMMATAEEILNALEAADEATQLQVFQALASAFGIDLGTAEDQEASGLRLPDDGQGGVAPHDLLAEQSVRGSFSERDDLTSPRATADQRPRRAHDRRIAQDRRYAPPDTRQQARNTADFLARFPMAARIQNWG